MASKPFELAVATFFWSSAMIGVIKSSFEQHLKFVSLSASSELASDEESVSDDVSFFWTSCLQNFKLPSCWFYCSNLFFSSCALTGTLKFLSMVLHTWTNINISNWQFLIPCYHQNSKGNLKHKHLKWWWLNR